ncbi:carboxypeptidase regulatory-like domain-containing protein, partial [candidate division KSB1 bacterium]|nr:carboxypeptidase regulatory-like domain-containing protein [candidate division KSB1 bacterium]
CKGMAIVDSNFTYQIDGLAAGNYYVCAWADGYVLKYYRDVIDFTQATAVPVTDGSITNDIDFNMEAIVPGTGSISGTVRRATDQTPIEWAIINVFSTTDPWTFGWAETMSDGSYIVTGLKSGQYYVSVWAEGFLDEYYDNVPDMEQATLVAVIEPNETSGIDFSLAPGGVISGRVTTLDGTAIAGAYLEALKVDSIMIDSISVIGMEGYGKGMSDDDGYYTIDGLPTGEYFVRADVWNQWTYVSAWYDNVLDWTSATPVPVEAGLTVSDIDFLLDLQITSGAIAGTVTDLQGNPIANAGIQVQSVFDSNGWTGFWTYTNTDPDGNYRVENLPTGSYLVSAWTQQGWEFVQRWWPDAETIDQAESVVVDENTSPDNINFRLPLTVGTATISGRVTNTAGHPLPGASIQLSSLEENISDPTTSSRGIWAWGYTDSSGYYRIEQLPAGSYLAFTSYWENTSFGQQWYYLADSQNAATPIVLADDTKRTDIDFVLNLKPMYGSISGTVTDSTTGQPIARAYLEISPRFYAFDQPSFCCMFWNYFAVTDEKGNFQVDWLWEGDYLISVYADGAFEFYQNAVVAEMATPVNVTGGSNSIVDFRLIPRNDGAGIIRGQVVTEGSAVPFEIAVVVAKPVTTIQLWPQSEIFYAAVTQSDGTYELRGLAPGEYYVRSFAPWTIQEYFDNVYDPTMATIVQVDGIHPTEKIDFQLSLVRYLKAEDGRLAPNSAMVAGKVTDTNGNVLKDVTILALNALNQALAAVQSNVDGSYAIAGLPPGDYIFQAAKLNYNSQYNGNVENFADAVALTVNSGIVELDFTLRSQNTIDIDSPDTDQLPSSVELYGNYPNPFNPETAITFALPDAQQVTLSIFNVRGEIVTQLHDGILKAGRHQLLWTGRNQMGQMVSSGIYFYRLKCEDANLIRKMLLIR